MNIPKLYTILTGEPYPLPAALMEGAWMSTGRADVLRNTPPAVPSAAMTGGEVRSVPTTQQGRGGGKGVARRSKLNAGPAHCRRRTSGGVVASSAVDAETTAATAPKFPLSTVD